MDISKYIKALDADYSAGKATEHTYRHALRALLAEAAPDVQITNEPKEIPCGKPDFLLRRGGVPLGYVETKDVGKNLNDKAFKAQFKRYSDALDNLIITDYLEFQFFREGKKITTARIGEIRNERIKPRRTEFAAFEDLLANFLRFDGVTVASADELARHMAAKARMLAAAINDSLAQDERGGGGELHGQLLTFREHLIHDITPGQFADIYAQTITYGMFAGRLTGEINPFLRRFFQNIAGDNLDERIQWGREALTHLFRAADVAALMAEYGKKTRHTDPFLHFYETFLGEYNPKLRKSRGVYYTPEPVVEFIVRAVDDILRGEFGLQNGIANGGKTFVEVEEKGEKKKREMHKVQILDPATGTGTFLAAIIRHIRGRYFNGQEGVWRGYARDDLIPRLNGFEVLMAPYVMAHIKLQMELRETDPELARERVRVFLTNALEESKEPDTTTLGFTAWLSNEARDANEIKRNAPVMVVIGNPPYSAVSSNMGDWISDMIEAYKYVDREHFGEKKHWLHDDYVKFIRYGQHHIDNTGEGVLAYICNHSFLDNPTFRGMRWNLLKSFDKIYIVDLHGNTLKKEVAPDGSKDANVFDIRQGVSINLFVKTGRKKAGELARVFHFDLFGERENKYQFLLENDLAKVKFSELSPAAPFYFFVSKNWKDKGEYDKGFSVTKLFSSYASGIVTMGDSFIVGNSKQEVLEKVRDFLVTDYSEADFKAKYSLGKNYAAWVVQNKAKIRFDESEVVPISYRPFDTKWTVYSNKLLWRWRNEGMRNFLAGENIGLIFKRGDIEEKSAPVFLTKYISESRSWSRSGMQGAETSAPLYIYPDTAQSDLDGKAARNPNLDPEIVKVFADAINLRFTPEKESSNKTFAPIDLLDYIYGVLHAPSYRERYNEFLKIDFPRAPYPQNTVQFRELAKLGGKLRSLHLMEPAPKLITTYSVAGDNTADARVLRDPYKITDAKKRLGTVHINAKQYFGNVPETAWNFFIGGYQPAQKYLKDRKDRRLSTGEIRHYQNIIAALAGTAKLMEEIDAAIK